MRTLAVSLAVALGTGIWGVSPEAQKAPPPETVRLYVFAAPITPKAEKDKTTETSWKDRVAAAKEIVNWLNDRKKKTITVVDVKEAADATVEIVAVTHAPGMSLTERTAGYIHGPRYDLWTVRVKITAGAFTNEMAKQGQFPSLAATGAAEGVEKWARENRESLLANRPAIRR